MTDYSFKNQAESVDIILLLESSYPLIFGGVSSWVHQIIENFPQYTFGLVFLGGAPENYKEGVRYVLPKNVTYFHVTYLFDQDDPPAPKKTLIGNQQGFDALKNMHQSFKCPSQTMIEEIGDVGAILNSAGGVDYEQFLYSACSWNYMTEEYTKQCEDSSFIDYFWTIKNIHKPLWKLFKVLDVLPRVKVIHSISTGYAGLLAFFIQRRFNYPVILTEHGIYTKERKIDIFLSEIFRDEPDQSLTQESYLRGLWDRYFKTLALLTYHASDPIISLFGQAQFIQIEEGADPKKTQVIPNGIDIERYKKMRRPLAEKQQVICFVGRIVPIKDVKGLIRAVPNLYQQMPDIKVWLVGSTDQDPEYAQECEDLVENILMQDVIEFMPHQKLEDVLPKVKVLVLSAIRESMPLVLLESFGAGIPVVATDVGACREMVTGLNQEDRDIGPAGEIVKVADPIGLEQAILKILRDPDLWEQMSQSAIKRVETFYDQRDLIQKYKEIYETAMS